VIPSRNLKGKKIKGDKDSSRVPENALFKIMLKIELRLHEVKI
jgi:hypothetical protein